jgi:hypothetical protein
MLKRGQKELCSEAKTFTKKHRTRNNNGKVKTEGTMIQLDSWEGTMTGSRRMSQNRSRCSNIMRLTVVKNRNK